MTTGESFYLTTPIYYPSDVPHIGHGYTTVAVDTLARWHRQAGDDTWMLTGTDEHGQKMLRAASANGVTPQQWVDKLVTESWFPMLKALDIANDDFIRTTQERHERNVQTFFQALYDRGYIYAGEYEALYCVGCEEFKPESEIVDGTGPFEGLKVCAIHSKPLELLHEKNYFFKLSEFQDRLLDLYDTGFIQPDSARNEIVSFVKQGLKDLSVSRSTFDWGIKVPWDESHVIYVWIDALLNYVTAVGYGSDPEEFARRWPAHHVVGKDILRFHTVIWPAMLMAAGVEVPKGVFAHGWLLVGGEKMSKSKLTGIAPERDHRRVRLGRVPLLLPLGDRVRAGRLVLLGGPVGALPGRARQRLRQSRLAHRRDDRAVLRGDRAARRRSTPRRTSRSRRRWRMPLPPPTLRSSGSASTRRSVRSGRSSMRSTATSPRTSRGRSRRTTPSAAAWEQCCTPRPRDCARLPCSSRR